MPDPITPPNAIAQFEAEGSKKTAAVDKKEKEKDKTEEDQQYVIDGAMIKCTSCMVPIGTLKVNFDTPTIQNKLAATVKEKSAASLQFMGNCLKSPKQAIPCKAVMSLGEWENVGTTLIQDQKPLIKKSTIKCNYNGGDTIAFVNSGQKNVPSVIDGKEKEPVKPKILDAYFVKLTSQKGAIIEEEIEVIDKKTKKKIKKKNKVQTKKIVAEKISERGLSYQVALVVETEGLSGKKLKVKIKTGKNKVLSDVNASVSFIDMKDVDKVSDPKKYKDVTAVGEFEIEVDNFAKNKEIENAADFKNKAVLKIMLNQRADDLSFELVELILANSDKKASVYIEVESTEKDIEYKGKTGIGGLNNTFLNEEGKYFAIKYLEQKWVETARLERKLGVTEATQCDRIINEYHQINREHKPKGCATITNAWCASFVGWCLKKANYSAQCDPGAYSYGIVNTRYRASQKTVKGKVVKTDEKFDDPIWAKTTENNKLALGSICVVNNKNHVTFAVAQNKEGTHFFGLGGNQGDAVKVSPYSVRNSSTYPIEYTILTTDYELPIYYRDLNSDTVA